MQYTDLSDASNGQRVGLEDDDESIISHPSRASVCGACRTRESQSWWKAPKGLATDILCEGCAMNWRKYADLNIRPLREESVVGSKNKASDKREGTPLAGPSAKRARVSRSSPEYDRPLMTYLDTRLVHPCIQLHLPLSMLFLRSGAFVV